MAALMGYFAAVAWIGVLVCNWPNRPRRILWLWASLGLFACINVVPVPTQFASAYRAGIPLFGFAGLIASLLAPDHLASLGPSANSRFVRDPRCIAVVVGGMATWCTWVTYQDVPNWHDEIVLMKAEVSADPNFVCARAALASFEDQNGLFEDALPQFDRCLTELLGANVSPERYPEIIRDPAMVRTLQSASTLRYYKPVQYIPQIVRERGRTLLLLHRPADALPDLRAALQLNSSDSVARAALELSYRELHQEDKAEAVRKMDDVLLGRKL
jgi:tetratricopeptide (TPR) repeat protein